MHFRLTDLCRNLYIALHSSMTESDILERSRRKRSMPNLYNFPGIYVWGMRLAFKLQQNSRCPGRGSKSTPPECRLEDLLLGPSCTAWKATIMTLLQLSLLQVPILSSAPCFQSLSAWDLLSMREPKSQAHTE
jgi:hypothetical protein